MVHFKNSYCNIKALINVRAFSFPSIKFYTFLHLFKQLKQL